MFTIEKWEEVPVTLVHVLVILEVRRYVVLSSSTFKRSIGPVRADFGLKFQVHLMKDFRHFLTLIKCLFQLIRLVYVTYFNWFNHLKRSDSSLNMKHISNMPNNDTFQMIFVINESCRIRVYPHPLYMLCIIIKYNLHFNIMNEYECGDFNLRRKPSKI